MMRRNLFFFLSYPICKILFFLHFLISIIEIIVNEQCPGFLNEAKGGGW